MIAGWWATSRMCHCIFWGRTTTLGDAGRRVEPIFILFFLSPLDILRLAAYTPNMNAENRRPIGTPCLCYALRQASRAVSRVYDEELRGVGLRNTQYSLLIALHRSGEVRQGDLGALTVLDETTLTRNPPPPRGPGLGGRACGGGQANDWFRSRRPGGRSSPRLARRGSEPRNGSKLLCPRVSGRAS